jgi:hypothetical protein
VSDPPAPRSARSARNGRHRPSGGHPPSMGPGGGCPRTGTWGEQEGDGRESGKANDRENCQRMCPALPRTPGSLQVSSAAHSLAGLGQHHPRQAWMSRLAPRATTNWIWRFQAGGRTGADSSANHPRQLNRHVPPASCLAPRLVPSAPRPARRVPTTAVKSSSRRHTSVP